MTFPLPPPQINANLGLQATVDETKAPVRLNSGALHRVEIPQTMDAFNLYNTDKINKDYQSGENTTHYWTDIKRIIYTTRVRIDVSASCTIQYNVNKIQVEIYTFKKMSGLIFDE